MAIINSEMWEEALRNTTGPRDTETVDGNTYCTKHKDITTLPLHKFVRKMRNTTRDAETVDGNTCCTKCRDTPLRKLVRKMPKVAKVVLNKCIVTNSKGKVSIMWLYRCTWYTVKSENCQFDEGLQGLKLSWDYTIEMSKCYTGIIHFAQQITAK